LDRFYTVEEIAEMLQIEPKDVNKLILSGRLDCVRINKYKKRITEAQLEDFCVNNSGRRLLPEKLDNKVAHPSYFPPKRKENNEVSAKALREEMRQW